MKFWLTCFVLLFAGAELFQWMVNLGGAGLSGAWLVLGGMGLAAASNAKHLPRLTSTELTGKKGGLSGNTDREQPATTSGQPAQHPPRQPNAPQDTAKPATGETRTPSKATASDQDSISFKVRLPWR